MPPASPWPPSPGHGSRGKTTLAHTLFPDKPNVSVIDHGARAFATADPCRFPAQFGVGATFDGAEHCPQPFSYLQGIGDERRRMGEVDLLVPDGERLLPVEIKSGATFAADWIAAPQRLAARMGDEAQMPWIVHGGKGDSERQGCRAVGWRELAAALAA